MNVVSIYKLKDKRYIIFGSNKTVSGFRIASEPVILIRESEVDRHIVGFSIKTSISYTNLHPVQDPENWKEFNKQFIQRIGVKSLKELEPPNAKLVSIRDGSETIIFRPMRPAKKPDKGFTETDDEKNVTIPSTASEEDIAIACEVAFGRCE